MPRLDRSQEIDWQRNRRLAEYGLKRWQADAMQVVGCQACGGHNSNGKRLYMDHNHETGQFRGFLCFACNTALGLLQESPWRAASLARYAEVTV